MSLSQSRVSGEEEGSSEEERGSLLEEGSVEEEMGLLLEGASPEEIGVEEEAPLEEAFDVEEGMGRPFSEEEGEDAEE